MFSSGKLSVRTFRVLSVAIAALAFSWTCFFGHWGIYAFDQSMIFDGAWRIYAGQVPYKDFLMAFAPVSFAIQALFFKLCGATWTATVVSAATLSFILTLSVIRTMVLLFGAERRPLALVTGGLVGISFEGIHGTLWVENCAFFFGFLGIQAVCESMQSGPSRQRLCFMAAGALAAVAFLCKQNVGPLAFILLLAMVVLAAPLQPKVMIASIGAFLAGAAIVSAVFILWLFIYSDPGLFMHYAIQVPSAMGRSRLMKLGMFFFPTLMSLVSGGTTWCNAAALGVWSFVLFEVCTQREKRMLLLKNGRSRLVLLLVLATPFIQAVFQAFTLNLSANILFMSPFTLGLSLGLCEEWFSTSTFRPLLRGIAAFLCLMLTIEIIHSTYTRDAMIAFPPHAKLGRKMAIAPLSHVRWINPTYATNSLVEEPDQEGIIMPEDVENTYAYLLASKKRFFVMGDSNYLYGITDVTPPGPMLYYQDDHYYTREDLPHLDQWTLSNLEKDDIRVVVEEKRMFCYSVFPLEKTRHWVEDNFTAGPVFGHFAILLRKSEGATPGNANEPPP